MEQVGLGIVLCWGLLPRCASSLSIPLYLRMEPEAVQHAPSISVETSRHLSQFRFLAILAPKAQSVYLQPFCANVSQFDYGVGLEILVLNVGLSVVALETPLGRIHAEWHSQYL